MMAKKDEVREKEKSAFSPNGGTKIALTVTALLGGMYTQAAVMDQRLKTIDKQNERIIESIEKQGDKILAGQKDLAAKVNAHETRISLLEASEVVDPQGFNDALDAIKKAAEAMVPSAG